MIHKCDHLRGTQCLLLLLLLLSSKQNLKDCHKNLQNDKKKHSYWNNSGLMPSLWWNSMNIPGDLLMYLCKHSLQETRTVVHYQLNTGSVYLRMIICHHSTKQVNTFWVMIHRATFLATLLANAAVQCCLGTFPLILGNRFLFENFGSEQLFVIIQTRMSCPSS